MLTSQETATALEGTLQVALGRLAQQVNGDKLRVVEVLQAHERLNEQGLRVAAYSLLARGTECMKMSHTGGNRARTPSWRYRSTRRA